MRLRKFSSRAILTPRFFHGVGAILLFALFAGTGSTPAFSQATPDGHWEGALKTPDGQQVKLSLDMARNAKTEWIASMGIPSQNASGLVVTNVIVDASSVKFVAVELMMSKVELTVGTDGRMSGTLTGPQGSSPIEFTRTGEAKVELIPPSPAVSKELEGDWEGTLQTPGGAFRMVFHFRNQPDNTVAATMDSLDRNEFGLPLDAVKQISKNVQVGVRIAHSEFQGTLNEQGSEIAGKFGHGENTMPLTLTKK
jgi:hypothetical protein